MKKEHQDILIKLYKRFIFDPLLLSNCHFIASETKDTISSLGYKSSIWLGETWVKDNIKDQPYSFTKQNGGHAWNTVTFEEQEWLVDNSIFHQHGLCIQYEQPIISEINDDLTTISTSDHPYVQLIWNEYDIIYRPIQRL